MSSSSISAPFENASVASGGRLVSLDTYRGMVMMLMASNGLQIAKVAKHFPENPLWQFLAAQTDHVRWQGCHLWDLIMPGFIFMVGVSVPYSIASRRRKGQGTLRLVGHAFWRSLVLVLLGILLWSNGGSRTEVSFINVLCQIGLGYWLMFLLAMWAEKDAACGMQGIGTGSRGQLLYSPHPASRILHPLLAIAFVLILVADWYWFYSYPLPGPSFDYASVGVPAEWHHLDGIAAHWDLNTNPANAFDQWFLNLFPRDDPFVYRAGGGGTINFIPSIATMLLGVMAAQWLRSGRDALQIVRGLVIGGLGLMAAGIALDPAILPGVDSMQWTLCPIIKCLWTPSYVLYSGGWVVLGLALLYWLVDVVGSRGWTFPFVVVGMNSLVMYLMAWFIAGWVRHTLHIHLDYPLQKLGLLDWPYGPIVEQSAVLAILWLVCFWLYRQRMFVRV